MTTRQTETEQLIRRAQARGWISVETKDGTVLRHPADVWGPGEGTIGLHRTQSDHRALANARAAMLRAEREARKRTRARKRQAAELRPEPAQETTEEAAARQRRDQRRREREAHDERERQAAELAPELPAIAVPVPEPEPAVDAATRYPELAEDFYSGITGLLAFLSGKTLDDFSPGTLAEMDAARRASERRIRNRQRGNERDRAGIERTWAEWDDAEPVRRKRAFKRHFDNNVRDHGYSKSIDAAGRIIRRDNTPAWAREALMEWLLEVLARSKPLKSPVPAAFQKKRK